MKWRDAGAPGLTPRQRLAILRERGRLRDQRSADDVHKATQEARGGTMLFDGGDVRRAASAFMSERERHTCILCMGEGTIVLPPDECGDEWYDKCPDCDGAGKVIVR